MSTNPVVRVTGDSSTSWPPVFAHPRPFNRNTENKPYLVYLDETDQHDYELDNVTDNPDDEFSDSDSWDDDDEEGHDEEVETSASRGESSTVDATPDSVGDPGIEVLSPVRRFNMKRFREEEYSVPHGERDDVADFVEHAMETRFSGSDGYHAGLVALLDVESKFSVDAEVKPRRRRAKKPTRREGLTRAQFRTELAKPRFPTQGSQTGDDADDAIQIDLNLRLMYIPNLDAPEIVTLASTATLKQRGALLNFLHHHVNPEPLIGVIIPPNGFKQFNLHSHLPYFALRRQASLTSDRRERLDGAPLRESWSLGHLSIPLVSPDQKSRNRLGSFLYDAQVSIAVVGIEENVWTSISTRDTFFEPNGCPNSLEHHHDLRSSGNGSHQQDPMSGWVRPPAKFSKIDPSFSNPRKYFLNFVEQQLRLVLVKEYESIVKEMDVIVNKGCPNKLSWKMGPFVEWHEDVQDLISRITHRLSDTLDALRLFKNSDLKYFTEDDKGYLDSIEASMFKLEGFHAKFEKRKKDVESKSSAINTKIASKNLDVTVQVLVLALLAVLFAPLSNVVSLFGIQQLPISLTPRTFGLMLMGFALAYFGMYWLLRNWDTAVKPKFAGAYGTLVSLVSTLVAVYSRIQAAVRAATGVLAGGGTEAGSESEPPGFPLAELPRPVQAGGLMGGPPQVGTWSSMSRTLWRRRTEDLEPGVAADAVGASV